MTTQEIRKLQEARPFRPFIIHTADGRKFPVMHPEFMASAPAARTLVVYQTDGNFDILDILLTATLEVRNNGAAPKRKRNR